MKNFKLGMVALLALSFRLYFLGMVEVNYLMHLGMMVLL